MLPKTFCSHGDILAFEHSLHTKKNEDLACISFDELSAVEGHKCMLRQIGAHETFCLRSLTDLRRRVLPPTRQGAKQGAASRVYPSDKKKPKLQRGANAFQPAHRSSEQFLRDSLHQGAVERKAVRCLAQTSWSLLK